MKQLDPNFKMLADITYTASFLDQKISKFLKKYDLTHIQFNILRILGESFPEPLAIYDLKKKLAFANSDMTRLLDRLVKKNFVYRNTDPDNRRKVNVTISQKGQLTLYEIMPGLAIELEGFYSSRINMKDAKSVSNILEKIRF